jgi:hypothetical protein
MGGADCPWPPSVCLRFSGVVDQSCGLHGWVPVSVMGARVWADLAIMPCSALLTQHDWGTCAVFGDAASQHIHVHFLE